MNIKTLHAICKLLVAIIDILRTKHNILWVIAASDLPSIARRAVGDVPLVRHEHQIVGRSILWLAVLHVIDQFVFVVCLGLLGRLLLLLLLLVVQVDATVSLDCLSVLSRATLIYLVHLESNGCPCWRCYN